MNAYLGVCAVFISTYMQMFSFPAVD